MKKILCAVVVLFFSVSASAVSQISNKKILLISNYASSIVVYYTPAGTSLEGCSSSSANRAFVLPKTGEWKDRYAMILSAQASDLTISAGVSGCSNYNLPLNYRLDVK